jgi:hypothetical protein
MRPCWRFALSRTWLPSANADLTYATGLNFAGIGPSSFEVDFTCWYRRRALLGRNEEPMLVFGEAKSFAAKSFKNADVERMSKVADKFPGAFIVFATLKDGFRQNSRRLEGQVISHSATHDEAITMRAIRLL